MDYSPFKAGLSIVNMNYRRPARRVACGAALVVHGTRGSEEREGRMSLRTSFTIAAYRELLESFLGAAYSFVDFPGARQLLGSTERFVAVRHDIDFELPAARRMAECENECGVRSTYFFMLSTEHYSVFSLRGRSEVERILDAGHHLGLHFDCAAYPSSDQVEKLAADCEMERQILGDFFGASVDVVSFHRPNALVLSGNPNLSAPALHTYMEIFTKQMTYRSDSRGEWGHGYPCETEAFILGQPMHLLVHPIWWNEGHSKTPRATIETFLEQKKEALERSVEENCTVYQRPRSIRVGNQ